MFLSKEALLKYAYEEVREYKYSYKLVSIGCVAKWAVKVKT